MEYDKYIFNGIEIMLIIIDKWSLRTFTQKTSGNSKYIASSKKSFKLLVFFIEIFKLFDKSVFI